MRIKFYTLIFKIIFCADEQCCACWLQLEAIIFAILWANIDGLQRRLFHPIGGNPVQSRWDGTKKSYVEGGRGTHGHCHSWRPNRFAMNCHMLSWRSIDEALVMGGQWRPKTWASWALRPRPWWQKKPGRHPDDFGWKLGGLYTRQDKQVGHGIANKSAVIIFGGLCGISDHWPCTGSPFSKSPLDDIFAVAKCKLFWEVLGEVISGTFMYHIYNHIVVYVLHLNIL